MARRVRLAQTAGIPALLFACTATLITPQDANITCSSDTECPADRRCQVIVRLCYDPTVADDEAPLLLTANAVDSTQVVLDFSERLNPASLGLGSLTIDPPLMLSDPVLLPNYRQLRVTTSLQAPGVEYAITVSDAADIFGNVIASGATASFFGFGATPDLDPPTILGPSSTQSFTTQDLTLVWTRPALAQSYTVEVAYDAAFTELVAGFPVTVADPDSSYSHTFIEPVRYYWRVRANSTRDGEYASSTIDRLGSVLHVYCPAGVACSDVDERGRPRPGNVSAPMQTISGAVNRAQAFLMTEVRIAARGNGEAYREHVVSNDISLTGGYDSAFADGSRTRNPTIVQSDDEPSVVMLGSAPARRVAGLTLRSARDAGIRITGASDLTLEDCDIAGGRVGIEATNFNAVLIRNNTIQSYPGSNGTGIEITGAERADVLDNAITVGACQGGPCSTPAGIRASAVSVMAAWDNGIDVAVTRDFGRAYGITTSDVGVDLQRNRISTGIGPSIGVNLRWADVSQVSSVTNNIVLSGATEESDDDTYAIIIADAVIAGAESHIIAVANNLFYAGGGPGTSIAAVDGQSGVTHVNNIYATGPGTTRICFSDVPAPGHTIGDLRNNLFFDCPTALYRDFDAGSPVAYRTSITAVNDSAQTTQGTPGSVANNITATATEVAFASFPTDVRLTAQTVAAIRFGGLNAAVQSCGAGGVLGCGAVTQDYDGSARTCPTPLTNCFSMGPFEREP